MVKKVLAELAAGRIKFADVLAIIDEQYTHKPAAFKNGTQYNNATENQGSARVLYFAYLHELSKEETLSLFAEHYQDVLDNPGATNHQNIRQFIKNGWSRVEFEGTALSPK
ncbi:MAG: HopJ type III effector protein [Agriterribacter sp.]